MRPRGRHRDGRARHPRYRHALLMRPGPSHGTFDPVDPFYWRSMALLVCIPRSRPLGVASLRCTHFPTCINKLKNADFVITCAYERVEPLAHARNPSHQAPRSYFIWLGILGHGIIRSRCSICIEPFYCATRTGLRLQDVHRRPDQPWPGYRTIWPLERVIGAVSLRD